MEKVLHPFIQLPSCYDWDGLFPCLLTVYLTPPVSLFTLIMHDNWDL
jgi:hypothetical protein